MTKNKQEVASIFGKINDSERNKQEISRITNYSHYGTFK